jgi:hypothetical protein
MTNDTDTSLRAMRPLEVLLVRILVLQLLLLAVLS